MPVTCRNVRHLHEAYLDGELSASMMAEVQAHLLQCPECQRNIELMRAAANVISADRNEPALSSGFASRVMASLPQSSLRIAAGSSRFPTRREIHRRIVRRVAAGFIPAAAAIIAFVVLVLPAGRPSETPSVPRLVAGESQYGPVDVLGVRTLIDPTLATVAHTSRAAGSIEGLYRMTVDDARVFLPDTAPTSPAPASAGHAFMAGLLHPFTDMMAPPATQPPVTDDVVRF